MELGLAWGREEERAGTFPRGDRGTLLMPGPGNSWNNQSQARGLWRHGRPRTCLFLISAVSGPPRFMAESSLDTDRSSWNHEKPARLLS